MKTLTILKRTIGWGVIGSVVLLAPLASQTLTVEEVTNPRQNYGGWVTDMADVLSDRTETELNNLITNLEQTNDTECDELTVTHTETTLKKATRHSKGKVLISDRCYCCDYSQEKTIDTPRLRPPSNRGGGSGGNRNTDY